MKKNIPTFIFFSLFSICIFSTIYFLSFSEKAKFKSHSQQVLEQTINEVIFSFENNKLVSTEINELNTSALKYKLIFKLTFKSNKGIKHIYLHDQNINDVIDKINKENLNTIYNMKIFQNNFSLFYNHFIVQEKRDYTVFMNDIFIKNGFAKK